MTVWRFLFAVVAVTAACGLGCHGGRPVEPSFRLVSSRGRVILSEADLLLYRWSTHTMILEDGTVTRLSSKVHPTTAFQVEASGVTCYEGQFVSPIISAGFSCPVIQMPIGSREVDGLPDTLSITLGYPTELVFRGDDPRGDPRILEALVALGKVER